MEIMKIMMKFKYIYALMTVVFFATACQDDELIQQPNNPAAIGDEIVFGGRAGFENSDPGSRTEYSEVFYEIEENGKKIKFERIDWIEGDKIEIYSPDAANGPTSHYQVTGFVSGDESENDGTNKGEDYATLIREGSSGLQWGKGYSKDGVDGYHDFYAMYPSSKMFDPNSESNVAKGIYMEGSIVKGIVPIEQNPISVEPVEKDGVTHYVAKPNMNYAYMVAKSTAKRADGSVSLSFVPIVTAVKVELSLPTSTTNEDGITTTPKTVNVAWVRVEGKGIVGSFSSELANWNDTYPSCTNSDAATDVVTLKLWQGEEGNQKPLAVKAGGSLTFTVFLLPGTDISSLKVSFSSGSGWIGKTLSGDNIFPAHKKTVVKDLHLPVSKFKTNVGAWMSQLDSTTVFSRLSIPGAGAAFSYNGSDGYKAQNLKFGELWNAGIRAFEIITDRQEGTDFGSEAVRCNNQAVSGVTVGSVMKEVTDSLTKYKKECAVLIFTYQPTGDLSYPRDPGTYVSNLCSYFGSNYTNFLVKYHPNLTLDDAQGKVIVIVRPSQIDEDTDAERTAALTAATNSTVGDKILVIDGCGTAKDKWRTRGYSNNNSISPEQGKWTRGTLGFGGSWASTNIEYSIHNNTWNTVTKPNDAEYAYDVNLEKGENYQVWYQEWARVVPDTNKDGSDALIINYGSNRNWKESYNEKLASAKKTFDMALSGEYNGSVVEKGPYVFVNSLSGYYVSDKYELSYKPLDPNDTSLNFLTTYYYNGGSQGDIAGLAQDLNEAFYQYVLSKGDQTGATGIVMMDFVANELTKDANDNPTNAGSYYLPGVIINNNFMFNTVAVPEAPNPEPNPSDPEEDA